MADNPSLCIKESQPQDPHSLAYQIGAMHFFLTVFIFFFFVASQVYPTAASFALAIPNSTLGLLILRVPLVRGACVDM